MNRLFMRIPIEVVNMQVKELTFFCLRYSLLLLFLLTICLSVNAQEEEHDSLETLRNQEREYLECVDEFCKAEKLAVFEESLEPYINKHREDRFSIPTIKPQPNENYKWTVRFTIKSISDSQYKLKLQSVKDIAHGNGVGHWGFSSIIRFEGKVRFPIQSKSPIGGGWLKRGTKVETVMHGLTNATIVSAKPTENALLFEGDPQDPLSFIFWPLAKGLVNHSDWLKSTGFVYFHGTGKVHLKDGSIVSLPPNK